MELKTWYTISATAECIEFTHNWRLSLKYEISIILRHHAQMSYCISVYQYTRQMNRMLWFVKCRRREWENDHISSINLMLPEKWINCGGNIKLLSNMPSFSLLALVPPEVVHAINSWVDLHWKQVHKRKNKHHALIRYVWLNSCQRCGSTIIWWHFISWTEWYTLTAISEME